MSTDSKHDSSDVGVQQPAVRTAWYDLVLFGLLAAYFA